MRFLFQSLRGAAVLLLAAGGITSHAAVEPGQPAPEFTFTDLAGKTHQLSEYRGKVVVLEWLSPGCPFVGRHYRSGNLPGTQATAAADGVVWLQVDSSAMGDEDPAQSVVWQKKNHATATAYIRDKDGKIGHLFGAENTPHLFVIAKDGTLAYQGAIDDEPNANQANTQYAHNYVKAALAALKEGKRVETAKTKPYGCGVKYGGP